MSTTAVPSTMEAIHFASPGSTSVLTLTTLPLPTLANPTDILVRIHGSSLNPVDTKARQGAFPTVPVLGFDAAGVVVSAGDLARFRPGDEVMFSGVLGRSGSNAQYAVVDSRIAGLKPKGWDWADASSLPLVGLTAWEMLELKFGLKPWPEQEVDETLLIVNGAGGVGSAATQLAKKVFKIKNVVVTASRNETVDWAIKNGATHVISHKKDFAKQLEYHKLTPSLVFICYGTAAYLPQICPLMRAWGQIGSIVEEPETPLPFNLMSAFERALSFHWEFMFARALQGYKPEVQGRLLGDIKKAAEAGDITSMVNVKTKLSVASLRKGHELQESGKAVGKIAFEVGDVIAEE